LDQRHEWVRYLLLEEVFEGLTGIVVARRGRRGGRSSLLCVGCWCGVFLDGGAKFVERAVVLGVLGRDAVRNRLRALKLSAAVEEPALLATVQFKGALGTLTFGIKAAGEHGATVGAAGARDGADHAGRARAELIGTRTTLRRLAVMRAVFLILLFRVAITAVIILSIHKRLHKPELAREMAKEVAASLALGRTEARPYNATDLYPIGLLHSTVNAIFPGLPIRIADAEQEMGHLCF
jgi:hypothetical protein